MALLGKAVMADVGGLHGQVEGWVGEATEFDRARTATDLSTTTVSGLPSATQIAFGAAGWDSRRSPAGASRPPIGRQSPRGLPARCSVVAELAQAAMSAF